MNPTIDYNCLAFVATQAALAAGEILRKGFGQKCEISSKPGIQNIVTEYDQASEFIILDMLKKRFPHHNFLAEEGGLSSQTDSSTLLWLIDPLDGTSNFARQIPIFAVSIGAYSNTEGVLGVIYQPMTNELFIAIKGTGAYLNGKKLSVSPIRELNKALIHLGLPSRSTKHPTIDLPGLDRFNKTGATARNFGSAALGLAYVAAGKMDGLWMNNLFPWDWGAGRVLIEEAGGQVTHFMKNGELFYDPSNVLATNPHLHSVLTEYIK